MSEARRHFLRDLRKLRNDATTGLTAASEADDIMNWDAVIFSPQGTIFHPMFIEMETFV
jgi:ubiquitin-protein ligase